MSAIGGRSPSPSFCLFTFSFLFFLVYFYAFLLTIIFIFVCSCFCMFYAFFERVISFSAPRLILEEAHMYTGRGRNVL